MQIVQAAAQKIEQEKPVNRDASDFAMRGWAGLHRPETEAQLRENEHLFEQALALDPQSLDAKIGMATVLVERIADGWSKSRQQDLDRAERLLTEASERDRNNARQHWAMGMLRKLQGRFVDAKLEFEKTIELDHNHAPGLGQLGFTLVALGQPEAALPYFEKTIQRNPRSQNISFYYFGLGMCHFFLDHLDRAIEIFRKAHALNSQVYFFPLFLAGALGLRGDIEEAKAALAEFLALKPQLRSLADVRRHSQNWSNSPPYAALTAKTLDIGLRRAGMPDE